MAYYLKIFNVLFISTVKYFYTPFYAYMIGLDFWGTLVTMIVGGILGFCIYYYLSNIVIVSSRHLKPLLKTIIPSFIQYHYNRFKHKRKLKRLTKKKFTRRNRILVKISRTYGMYTIIILTPILISLVLGAFLLRKYYGDRHEAIPLMILSIAVEGAILVVGYWYLMGDL
ncbi:MAG: hypothetical protein H8E34_00635 [Bacteroidetes bacterium]|nr:hypothetical protein [Bacteroidota bacterium]MBL6944114.1 hypothetical protein [Bacteroidales bacterium]